MATLIGLEGSQKLRPVDRRPGKRRKTKGKERCKNKKNKKRSVLAVLIAAKRVKKKYLDGAERKSRRKGNRPGSRRRESNRKGKARLVISEKQQVWPHSRTGSDQGGKEPGRENRKTKSLKPR